MNIKECKQLLKDQAKLIRDLKSQRKSNYSGYVPGLDSERRSYRLRHIAYCLARGRTLEQIEPKVAYYNELTKWDMSVIDSIIKDLTGGVEVLNVQE